MTDAPPRVKLPELTSRKPVAPGPNSWAQSQVQAESNLQEHESPRPTNRDRYENKPMPKLPQQSPGQNVARPYIQPAIPLVGASTQPNRRAVTDPAAPKALFIGRKPSVNQLRNAFGHSRQGSRGDKHTSPPLPYLTGKAAEILGLTEDEGSKRSATPKSDSVSAKDGHAMEYAKESFSVKSTGPSSTTQPAPIPTIQHHRNDSQATVNGRTENLNAKYPKTSSYVSEDPTTPRPDHQAEESGRLAPPKIASYGKVGDTGVLQGQGIVRVESVQGIIEHASGQTTPTSPTPSQHNLDLLQPVSYSPNDYGGVWEKDPAVGYSLPPFSPFPLGNAGRQKQPPFYSSAATTPSVYGHDNYTTASYSSSGLPSGGFGNRQVPRFDDYRQALGSANSWAQANSATSDVGPMSGASSQRWPHQHNPVPSPPHSQRDYERPGSLVAGLTQLDTTIHHHIDAAFGSLSRLVIDKNDRVLDQVLVRLDDIEDAIGKNAKHLKPDIKNVNGEIHKLKAAINNFNGGNESIKVTLNTLESKMNALEKHAEESQRLFQQIIAKQTALESESERQDRNSASAHRRAESAHGALGISQEGQQQQNGGTGSRAASRVRTSKASNRSHRSNTASSQPVSGMIDDAAGRKEHGRNGNYARGPVPDLRNHPAYAGIPQPTTQMYDQNGVPIGMAYNAGVPYGTQQFGDGGWYHQAYGST